MEQSDAQVVWRRVSKAWNRAKKFNFLKSGPNFLIDNSVHENSLIKTVYKSRASRRACSLYSAEFFHFCLDKNKSTSASESDRRLI